MRVGRSKKGWVGLGDLRLDRLGLSSARTSELVLTRAWREAAGEAIARRAPAERIRRGVLELRVPDGNWAEALIELLPRLAARLATSHPELGVVRFRLLRQGRYEPSRPERLPEAEEPFAPTHEDSAASNEAEGDGAAPIAERLQRAMERYLARSQKP
jgi:hypothetical protein